MANIDYLKDLKVLVVEDDKDTQFVDKGMLASIGVTPKFANNGLEAIEEVQKQKYDLVLMDVNMPVQDGLDATRWIRDMEGDYFKNVPIFALTSFPTREHTEEIIESGMNEHLVKPLDIDEFCMKMIKYKFRAKS
ncbi:MAG: response regulator [Cyclobacteriaceae bacterium]|nr:response regulator [Cyclobacteriaceae bacterium]